MKSIANLDGVRGFAVVFVVLFHQHYLAEDNKIAPWGWMGVQLFFVLSGFLISGILLESKELPLRAYLRRFYIRRVLRIFPLYFGYLGVLAIVFAATSAPAAFGEYWAWLCSFLFNWTRADDTWQFSRSISHFWSIAVEEQFYLVWPFVVFFCSRRAVTALSVLIIAACPFVRWWFSSHYTAQGLHPFTMADATYWNTFGQIDAFAMGALIASMPATVRQRVSPHLVLAVGVVTFLVAGIGAQLYMIREGLVQYPIPEPEGVVVGFLGFPFPLIWCDHQIWGYTVIDLLFATIVFWAVSVKDTWLLCNRAIVDIGRVSYGIYILHHALIDLADLALPYIGIDPHGALGLAIYFAALWLISRAVFAWWERPFLRMKAKLAP